MTTPDINLEDSSGEHARPNKKNKTLVAGALAGVLSGSGISTLLPFLAPSIYRPDPATGTEIRELEVEVRRLQRDFDDFLREGPREVRANQDRILVRLETILRKLEAHEYSAHPEHGRTSR